ncbi:MAG: replicative helicase loader/inhibitor [Lachnospirales bacterium]
MHLKDKNELATTENRVDIDLHKTPEELIFIKKQAAKLVKICVTAYPNSDKFQNEEAVSNTVNLWANYFSDDNWRVVAIALQKHIAISKWVPSIADIRELMVDITRPDLLPPDEAWSMVNTWLCSASEYNNVDVFSVFPFIVAETIEACGGKNKLLSLFREQGSGKAGLDKLTFRQLYEPKYQREKQKAMMPIRLINDTTVVQKQLYNDEVLKIEASQKYIENLKEERERKLKLFEMM